MADEGGESAFLFILRPLTTKKSRRDEFKQELHQIFAELAEGLFKHLFEGCFICKRFLRDSGRRGNMVIISSSLFCI